MRRYRALVVLALCLGSHLVVADEADPAADVDLEEPSVDGLDEEPVPDPEALPAPADEEIPLEEPPAREPRNSASQQWVITHKMRAALADLGYTETEVAALDPQRAKAIIDKAISRPSGGVPAKWNKGAKGQPRGPMGLCRSVLSPVRKVIGKAPGGPVVGAIVLLGGAALGSGRIGGGGGEQPRRAVISAMLEKVSAPAPVEEAPAAVWVEEEKPAPAVEELWLDRQIDNIGRFFMRLLGKR